MHKNRSSGRPAGGSRDNVKMPRHTRPAIRLTTLSPPVHAAEPRAGGQCTRPLALSLNDYLFRLLHPSLHRLHPPQLDIEIDICLQLLHSSRRLKSDRLPSTPQLDQSPCPPLLRTTPPPTAPLRRSSSRRASGCVSFEDAECSPRTGDSFASHQKKANAL